MRFLRGPARVVGALVAVIMIMGMTPAQAASSSLLCRGFVGCLTEGLGSAGYRLVFRDSHWNMAPGHSCTNYVAYRLSKGRVVARPTGAVDAATWGPAARREGIPVTSTPRPGDIAWWKANYHGASAAGHVAYVESVRKDGRIVVSEDNFDNSFAWRIMPRGSSSWPSGFIRFPESDGSPSGKLISVESPSAGVIDFWGASSDPDAAPGKRDYLVSIGGPRDQAGVETFTFSSGYFRFHWIKTLRTKTPSTMYLYALNAPGTVGEDRLLGVRTFRVKTPTAVSARLVDSSISRARRPQVRVRVGPGEARGEVDVLRGSKRIGRVTISSPSRRTVTLPRQPKGRARLTVVYRGSKYHARSSTSVLLRVR